MTEIERLIEEKSLPLEFLNAEDRCGYEISTEIKKIWALQIDLYKQVEKICDRHGLKCFAVGGTAIGAVRHKGMIPWDDDLDIALPRPDYNLFLEYAQKELEQPYFLQTVLTDPVFFRPHAMLRNSNTTCVGKWDQHCKCNNGIYIDIFPLDGFVDNKECHSYIQRHKFMNQLGMNNYRWKSAKNQKLKRVIVRLVSLLHYPGGNKQIYLRHEAECKDFPYNDYEIVGIHFCHFLQKLPKITWRKEIFDSVVKLPFEYTDIYLPVGYDEMLRKQFGDYMQFPPVETRGNKHLLEYAPDIPYKEYCAKKYRVRY